MGILSALRMVEQTDQVAAAVADVDAAYSTETGLVEVTSPFSGPSHLQAIVWSDVYGDTAMPLTRAAAIAVPALARTRHLVAGTIARLPLAVFRGEEQLPVQPTWTYRTDFGLPPYHRMLWTVDDLIFYGWSLWVVRRGADDQVVEAARVDINRWKFDARGQIQIDGKDVNTDEVVLIPGPHEGVLNFGRTPILQASELEDRATRAASQSQAQVELHYTGEKTLTPEEIQGLVTSWAAARRGDNGGVAYTSKYIEVKEHGAAAEHLLIEGRNAAAVNMARLVSAPAAMIDATNAGASLTYETVAGRNAEFIDYGLSLYMAPITARLSMDDVVPRGQSVRFDTAELRDPAPTPTGAPTED